MTSSNSSHETLLRRSFSRLSNDALRSCASHFYTSRGKELKSDEQHAALVDITIREVAAQGIQELFSSLLADAPEQKKELFRLLRKSEADIILKMTEDLMGFMQNLAEAPRNIIMKALDISESKPEAMCEQLYINGLDAFFSNLLSHRKLNIVALEFGVSPDEEDAVEQIIDKVLPPPGAAVEPAKIEDAPLQEAAPATTEIAAAPEEAQQVPSRSKAAPPPPAPAPAATEEKLPYNEHVMHIRSTRPPLQKGISLDDIQNMYWVDELKTFCKENNIKCTGKKAALNRAVHNFLNTGEKPKPPPRRKGTRGTPKRKKLKTDSTSHQEHGDDQLDSDGQEEADNAEDDAADEVSGSA